jgi:hypothetical protein
MYKKYTIREYNPSMHNFNVGSVDYSYMFQLLQSNYNQAAYQKNKKKIIILYFTILYYIVMCVIKMFEKGKIR